ncbi:hypothetical protein GH733_005987 [Mirounga leonina]|nr:hypothetical protein GH733_005987 [Mirounga leonina]
MLVKLNRFLAKLTPRLTKLCGRGCSWVAPMMTGKMKLFLAKGRNSYSCREGNHHEVHVQKVPKRKACTLAENYSGLSAKSQESRTVTPNPT